MPGYKRTFSSVDAGIDSSPIPTKQRKLEQSSSLIRILVGAGATPHTTSISASLLTASSPFFTACLAIRDGYGFKESIEKTIRLPSVSVPAWKLYAGWLRSGRLSFANLKALGMAFGDCYELGDYLLDTAFKDACVSALTAAMSASHRVPRNLPNVVYPLTTESSAHRRFVLDVALGLMDAAIPRGVVGVKLVKKGGVYVEQKKIWLDEELKRGFGGYEVEFCKEYVEAVSKGGKAVCKNKEAVMEELVRRVESGVYRE